MIVAVAAAVDGMICVSESLLSRLNEVILCLEDLLTFVAVALLIPNKSCLL